MSKGALRLSLHSTIIVELNDNLGGMRMPQLLVHCRSAVCLKGMKRVSMLKGSFRPCMHYCLTV